MLLISDDSFAENFVIFAAVDSYTHLIQCAAVHNKISQLSGAMLVNFVNIRKITFVNDF